MSPVSSHTHPDQVSTTTTAPVTPHTQPRIQHHPSTLSCTILPSINTSQSPHTLTYVHIHNFTTSPSTSCPKCPRTGKLLFFMSGSVTPPKYHLTATGGWGQLEEEQEIHIQKNTVYLQPRCKTSPTLNQCWQYVPHQGNCSSSMPKHHPLTEPLPVPSISNTS